MAVDKLIPTSSNTSVARLLRSTSIRMVVVGLIANAFRLLLREN